MSRERPRFSHETRHHPNFRLGDFDPEWVECQEDGWCRDPWEPKFSARRYAILLQGYKFYRDGEAWPWREWTKTSWMPHPGYFNPEMKELQKKNYIGYEYDEEEDRPFYHITEKGVEYLTRRGKIKTMVKKDRCGELHADLMRDAIRYYLTEKKIGHLRVDWVQSGSDFPDLLITPFRSARADIYFLRGQFAVEVETDPLGHPKNVERNFGRNYEHGWPTVFVPAFKDRYFEIRNIFRSMEDPKPSLMDRLKALWTPEDVIVDRELPRRRRESSTDMRRKLLETDREALDIKRQNLEARRRGNDEKVEKLRVNHHDKKFEVDRYRAKKGRNNEHVGLGTDLLEEIAEADTLSELDRIQYRLEEKLKEHKDGW